MAEALSGQTPIFGGSTGGLLSKADREEKYVITWTSPKEQAFEMPTGGTAIMRQGPNKLELARKEYGIALGGQQLRVKFKITDYKIYRVYPNGETQLLHPNDGVFPEKVNPGRPMIRYVDRNIGRNLAPAKFKFSGMHPSDSPEPRSTQAGKGTTQEPKAGGMPPRQGIDT